MADIKESDWKVFKRIKENAIDRFCKKCLSEYAEIISDDTKGNHEKYLYLYRIVENYDKQMEVIFGDRTSRSKAFLQLLAIRGEGLATKEEISELSEEFQKRTDPSRVNW